VDVAGECDDSDGSVYVTWGGRIDNIQLLLAQCLKIGAHVIFVTRSQTPEGINVAPYAQLFVTMNPENCKPCPVTSSPVMLENNMDLTKLLRASTDCSMYLENRRWVLAYKHGKTKRRGFIFLCVLVFLALFSLGVLHGYQSPSDSGGPTVVPEGL